MTVSCIELTYLLKIIINPGSKNSFKCYCLKALVSNLKQAGTEENMGLIRKEGTGLLPVYQTFPPRALPFFSST